MAFPNGPRFAVALAISSAAILTALATPTHARDTLILTDGDRLSGTLLELTARHVVLSTAHSGRVEVNRAAVVRIEFDQQANATEKTTPPASLNTLPHTKPSAAVLAAARGRGPATEKPVAAAPVPIGRPEDLEDIRKLFLRQSAVLLSPGEYEVEYGAEYQRTRVSLLGLSTTSRQFSVPLGLRVGLAERWQAHASLPLVYGQQGFSDGTQDTSQHRAGLGDLSAGLNYQAMKEGGRWPDVVASFGISAPTGRSPYADNGNGVALGSGHWAANGGVQFVKTVDPVALYGGISYTHQFARTGLGKRIKPGNAFGYNLGLSFAINDTVSVSGEFVGSAQGAVKEDGLRVAGSAAEPMQFRTGLIYRATKDWYLSPTLAYGLNSDAPDVVLGITSSHRFK